MIAVKDIAYVRYQVPDLEKMETFLCDFGLQRSARTETALYMRAAGGLHHVHIAELGETNQTIGFGFLAQSAADLEKLAAVSGVLVEDSPEPGGGKRVRLKDPAGFIVDVVHGMQTVQTLPLREPIAQNAYKDRRRMDQVVRLKPAPSGVVRLGHIAVLVPDFKACFDFYTQVLGFKPSDSYYAGNEDNTIAAFMHCGLGDTFTDHHTLALITAQDGQARFDHTAFEVIDLDDLMQGSEYLKAKGYQHSWGIGRHIQGSQLFDYWRDPFGNKIEHWTDGDLVNDSSVVGHALISNGELSQWAPPLTPEFFQ